MGLRRVCTPRDTRKLLAKVQLHRKVYRHTRKYMKIILKGSQRHIDTRPTAHFISTPPSSHSPFFVCVLLDENFRKVWELDEPNEFSGAFQTNLYTYVIFGMARFFLRIVQCFGNAYRLHIARLVRLSFLSLLCRCVSLSMCVCCVCVCERVRCFLCHLHTLHYVSGVRCIFFGSLASLHSVGGSGCFFCIHYSTFLPLSFFRLFNVHSTLYNSNTECILNRSIYIICLSV